MPPADHALMINLALCITVLPLAAFVGMVFFGQFLPRKGDWLPTASVGIGLVLSLYLLFAKTLPGLGIVEPAYNAEVYSFLKLGSGPGAVNIGFSVLVDNLTVVMLVVVTLVSFLVHVFSMGYMHGDPKYTRFFAFLGLFTFSMLGLLIAGNLLLLFIFWELVGVCSYFLIGHFFEKDYPDPKQITPRAAAVKAFITTRVGDLGFFLGIIMCFAAVGQLDFPTLFRSAIDQTAFDATWGTMGGAGFLALAGICLFIGPVGKSAQFPLHTWLPDAMEGPTPVSALIHAATMVAAGVYLVARMFPVFAGLGFLQGNPFESPALLTVALTGGFTAIFAATIAIVQTDIKKVLAYSTVSQLGYMMLGIGAGSVGWGMYHLFTHAMFKAGLFLGSGSVIHGMHHEQDMRHMGGLRHKMPITFGTMLVCTLAISGVPLLSGFVSKDGILLQAFTYGMWGEQHAMGTHASMVGLVRLLPWVFATCAAALTAFYMFRMIFLTFTGTPRSHHAEEAHESPRVMTIPLIVLAGMAIFGAGLAVPGLGMDEWFTHRVTDASTGLAVANLTTGGARLAISADEHSIGNTFEHMRHGYHWFMVALSVLLGACGIGFAWLCYAGPWKGRDLVSGAPLLPAWRTALVNLYYVDWFYSKVVVGIVMATRLVLKVFDMFVVDGLVNLAGWIGRGFSALSGAADAAGVDGAVRGTGEAVLAIGADLRKVQSGRLGDYVWGTVFSLAVIVIAAAVFGLGMGH